MTSAHWRSSICSAGSGLAAISRPAHHAVTTGSIPALVSASARAFIQPLANSSSFDGRLGLVGVPCRGERVLPLDQRVVVLLVLGGPDAASP